jgi:DNA polymerase-1
VKLALVFDAPRGEDPIRRGIGGAYLTRSLEAVERETGVSVEVEAFYAVQQKPLGKEPKISEIRAERERLLRDLLSWQPDKVLSLGKSALNAVAIDAPKALALSKERGRMRLVAGIPWVPTLSPYAVVARADLHRDFIYDLWKIVRQDAPIPQMPVDLIIPEADDLEEALEYLDLASVIAVDVETSGLRPARDTVLAVGLGAVSDDGSAVAVVVTRDVLTAPGVDDLLYDAVWRASRRTVGHNFKFDMQFLAPLIGFSPDGALLGDTLLLSYLLDERPNRPTSRVRGLGLKDQVAVRYDYQYGFDFGEFYQSEVPDWDEMHRYLGDDVAYTARLWHDLKDEAAAESHSLLHCHDDLLIPVSTALARAEFRGAPVSVPWIEETLRAYDLRIERRRRVLESTIGQLTARPEVNIGAPQQVADVMYDDWKMTPDVRKHGKLLYDDRSTDKDHLKAAIAKYRGTSLDTEARWLETLAGWRRDVRQRTTVQKSLLDRVDTDERVRASFLIHGTSTGRLSSQGPNLQNIPAIDREDAIKFRPMRRAFQPTPPRLWVEVDYSQLELRVAAGLSQDPDFIEVFRSGRDVHTEIATSIFSKPADQVSKAERFLAKAVSFGILYGRGAEALATGAEARYVEQKLGGRAWTVDEATVFRSAFLRAYPRLSEWMQELYDTVPRAGYVESPYGRRRRFPLYPKSRGELGSIERQAVNTPVQSAASDICLEAMVQLDEFIDAHVPDAAVLFTVHDSICLEVSPDDVYGVRDACREIMEKDWHGVPLRIDFEAGPTWADVKELP